MSGPWDNYRTPAPSSGPWDDYADDGAPWEAYADAPAEPAALPMVPTGAAHDGDTFRLSDGRNARLWGYDAPELEQTGIGPNGQQVPIGTNSRNALLPYLTTKPAITSRGGESFGRPVVALDQQGQDPIIDLLRRGHGIVAPKYLATDPARLTSYMDAQRFASMNHKGAFDTTAPSPEDFRRGNVDAIFFDDKSPPKMLPADIEKGYLDLLARPDSTVADVEAYGNANGFTVDRRDVEKFIANREKGVGMARQVTYTEAPRVLTNPGDGAFGAGVRGFADPVNLLDEIGGVVDSIVPGERENVWKSDRRFGDILWSNIEQNRSILDYDDEYHPYARFGGQLASGLVVPGGSVRGVGMAAARTALRGGAGRFAAAGAAKRAVTQRLATVGAAEGTVAGVGAGETNQERILGGMSGGVAGAALGTGLSLAAPAISDAATGAWRRIARRGAREADADPSAQRFVDGAVDAAKAQGEDLAVEKPVGRFGTIHADLADDYPAAFEAMAREGGGEVPGAIQHPAIGPVDLIWGTERYGLRHIAETHPEVLAELPDTVQRLPVAKTPDDTPNGHFVLEDANHRAIIAPDFDGEAKRWVVTAYERKTPGAQDARREPLDTPGGGSPGDGVPANINPRGAPGNMPMASEGLAPATLSGPLVRDVIEVQRPGLMADGPSDLARMQSASALYPADVLPLPSNTVRDLDEAERIAAGRIEAVKAPNERKELSSRGYTTQATGAPITRRGPADLVTWLRSKGGLKPDAELTHYGIDNTPRDLDFAKGEQQIGRLIDDSGLNLDDAAEAAWEAGYFPELNERPTINEFLDALNETHAGRARRFLTDDFEEVERFLAARDERHAVEAAQFEGAPLSVDKGQPIGEDDLDALSVPVRAYEEWGENAPDFAGNINLTKLNSPQEIKRALTQINRVNGGFDAATRGRITHAETEALAADLGMTTRTLLERRRGQAFNAEEALAARQILAKAGNEVVNLARKISRGDASERDMLAFRRAIVQAGAIQEQVAGITSEAGRALSAMRAVADAKAVPGYVLQEAMEALGGSKGAKLAAETILNASTPSQVAKTVRKLNKPTWFDKGLEYYYNSMLSGPQTHAVNILSNTLTALGQLPETAAAATVGAVRRPLERAASTLTGLTLGNDERMLFSEVGARTIGMLAGGREGLKQAGRTFLTGELSDQSMKVETGRQRAIGGLTGSIIRTPTRALAAEDEFFKAVARRSEIYAQAVRLASREGNRGQERWARVAELVTNPTEEMEAVAHDFAKYQTFQRSLSTGHGLSAGVQMTVNKFPVLKLALPFVRTPANLMKFAMERSPAAPLVKEWRKDFTAGGARRDAAIGKFMVGSAALGAIWSLAQSGLVTGAGPADEKAKALLQADGWQPYSFKVGETYYAYQRFDPFAALFGTVANFHEVQSKMTDKQRERAAMTLISATIHNLRDKVWLQGLSDLVNASDDPERYWDAYAKRLAGSVVPAGLSQIARTIDPTLRETDDWLDAIKARTPGLSQALAPRRDALGREIVGGGGVGPDIISPLWTSARRNDPIVKGLLDAGIGLTKFPAQATIPKELRGPDGEDKLSLSRSQRSDFDGLVGDIARPKLSALIASPDWKEMSAEDRKGYAGDIIKEARADARAALLPSFLGRGAKTPPVAPPTSGPWDEY